MDTPTRARRLYARDRRDFGPDAFAKIGQFRSMTPGAAAIDSENQEPLDFEAGIDARQVHEGANKETGAGEKKRR
jgi:hypothetical protein